MYLALPAYLLQNFNKFLTIENTRLCAMKTYK